MGLLDNAIDEQQLTDGITAMVNRLFDRLVDEILARKKVKITIELEDKEQ